MAFGKKIGGGRRAGQRERLLLPAILLKFATNRHVEVLDVSETGAKLRDVEPTEVGSEVWLRIGMVERLSKVHWARGGFCGVKFDEPLTRRELAELSRQNAILEASELKPEERLAVGDWTVGLAR